MMSPKVLIAAENASPCAGGEAFIALQYFKFFREIGVDAHLLVHGRWQKELQELLPGEIERLHFVHDSLVNIWCYRAARTMRNRRVAFFTLGAISHLDTQIRQRQLAQSLVKTHHLDIIHEPTPVSPKLPSIMFRMSVPVVIGPMNGGMDFPTNYNSKQSFERFMMFVLRILSSFWNMVLPGKLCAALLLVANARTYRALPWSVKWKPIRRIPENGVDLDLFKPVSCVASRQTINIIYVGSLLDWKRVDLLIAACSSLIGKLKFQLHIVGDGPERLALEKQAQQLSLRTYVRMHGLLSHSAVADMLRNSDIMVHPSMRECGGAVILEAMASGVPVIAADWGGPSDYVDANSGILIPPSTPDKFVRQLANAILLLSGNRQLREKLGKVARQRVLENYDWRAKAEAMLQIYQDVLCGVQESAHRKAAKLGRRSRSLLGSASVHGVARAKGRAP